jgi:hypothetical protein
MDRAQRNPSIGGGKGIDKMIDLWIARHDELPALPTERRLLFFTVALAERRGQLLIENIRGLPTAFRAGGNRGE